MKKYIIVSVVAMILSYNLTLKDIIDIPMETEITAYKLYGNNVPTEL